MGTAANHNDNKEVETGTISNQNDITNPSSADAQANNPNDISTVNSINIKAINQDELCSLIWIDARVNYEDNNFYKSYILKNYNNYEIFSFENVVDGIDKLKKFSFKEVYIIVSGRLYKDFIINFMNNLTVIKVIPKIIIFTGNKQKFLENNNDLNIKNILNNKYYNLGGIQTNFDEILNFLTTDEWKIRPILDEIKLDGELSNELTFEYIDSFENLLLPRFFRTMIKMDENDNYDELNQYIYNKYSDSPDIKELFSQIEGIPSIPHEILCKYYARLYTIESDFYNNINKSLRKRTYRHLPNKKIKNFPLSFTKLLYEGLKLHCFSFECKKKLYRFSCMSKSEKEKLNDYLAKKKEGLPAAICFSKSFLSFSEERKVAEAFFLKHCLEHPENDEYLNIIYILEKKDNISNESLNTFINLSDIAKMTNEKEVLFLPFSAFEIENIKEVIGNNINYYEIKINYLDKYTDKLNLIRNNEILSNNAFKKEFIESGFIDEKRIEKKTNKNLIDEANKFDKSFLEYKQKVINNEYNQQIIKELNKELIYDVKKEDIDENGEVQILGEHKEGDDFVKLNRDKSFLIINGKREELCYKYKLNEGINRIEIVFKENVTNFRALFKKCTSLIDISPLKNWDVKDATCFSCSFRCCTSLQDISPLKNWNLSNVSDLTACFEGDTSLMDISPLENWDVSKVNLMSGTFSNCTSLSDISPLKLWNVSNVSNFSMLFDGCKNLKNISSLKDWKVDNCTNFNFMFKECSSLQDISPLKNWNVSQGFSFDGFFKNCYALNDINPIKNWKIVNGNNFHSFFENCIKLTDIRPLDNWNVPKDADCRDLYKDARIENITTDSWYVNKKENNN